METKKKVVLVGAGFVGMSMAYALLNQGGVDELSKEFGPKSGTGRILMVDGEPQTLNKESGPLLDYYVVQAYYCRSDEVSSL